MNSDSGDLVDRIDQLITICPACKKPADWFPVTQYGRCYRCAFGSAGDTANAQIAALGAPGASCVIHGTSSMEHVVYEDPDPDDPTDAWLCAACRSFNEAARAASASVAEVEAAVGECARLVVLPPRCPVHGPDAMALLFGDDWYCEACENEALDRSLLGRFTALGAAGEVFLGLCVNEVAKAFAHAGRLVRVAAGWLRGRRRR